MADNGKQTGGRPAELTAAMVATVYLLARQHPVSDSVAAHLGVSRSTYWRWLRRGAQEQRRRERGCEPNAEEELYVKFWDAVKTGRAEFQRASLDTIRAASAEHWQAAAWMLERIFPYQYSAPAAEMRRLRKAVLLALKAAGQNTQDIKDLIDVA